MNDYFLEKRIDSVTGLGDKFFLIFSMHYENTNKKDIKNSIKFAQKELSILIR